MNRYDLFFWFYIMGTLTMLANLIMSLRNGWLIFYFFWLIMFTTSTTIFFMCKGHYVMWLKQNFKEKKK